MKTSILAVAVALALVSCSTKKETRLPEGVGINVSNMDTSVRPSDDFFKYVNGAWLNKTEIPAEHSVYGGFIELHEKNEHLLLSILEKAAKDDAYKDGSDQRKAATFYSIGMDSLLAERVGVSVLTPYFEQINAIKGKADLQKYLESYVLQGGNAFFNIAVFSDLKRSGQNAVYIVSGGIGLPERDYYLKQDEKSKETRQRYIEHLSNLFVLAGDDETDANKQSKAVLALETRLAESMLSKEDSRDPYKIYHPFAVRDLPKLLPAIQWDSYFNTLDVKLDSIIVTEPEFLKRCEDVIAKSSLNDIKTYLRACLLRSAANHLNHAFVQESFNFNQKYLLGVEKMRPRWKRVLGTTNNLMGEAIGQLYVDEAFPPEAKQKALEMVENIKLAFADRIKQLDWMSDSTKEMALAKLSKFRVKIGYPDKWIDYSALEVESDPERSSYYANRTNALIFETRRQLAKAGKPVDREEWEMVPQEVNAYHNPTLNEIVFPAAILQPPFYDYRADDAVNYGGIGAVIGHEISHAFDDQGSKFDGEGNLNNWFTEQDLTKFQQRGKRLARQFDQYEPLPGVFVQGDFTLGENIGDLGGVTAAFEGLQRFYREHGKPGPIDGFTPEQRFFISWATVWRIKYRDDALRNQVQVDPHSPAMYRVNGPLSNFTPFYEAFNVQEGDNMFRPDSSRVTIW